MTNNDITLRNAGALTNIGTGAAIGVPKVIYAERFPNADVLPLLESGATVTTGLFHTGVFDASIVGKFRRASIVLGSVGIDGAAQIDLNYALDTEQPCIGQDSDLTPFYFNNPRQTSRQISRQIRRALQRDSNVDVFLVLEARNNPPVGDSGLPPLLGLAVEAPTGNSFLSVDGGPSQQRTTSNWVVEMKFTPQEENGS